MTEMRVNTRPPEIAGGIAGVASSAKEDQQGSSRSCPPVGSGNPVLCGMLAHIYANALKRVEVVEEQRGSGPLSAQPVSQKTGWIGRIRLFGRRIRRAIAARTEGAIRRAIEKRVRVGIEATTLPRDVSRMRDQLDTISAELARVVQLVSKMLESQSRDREGQSPFLIPLGDGLLAARNRYGYLVLLQDDLPLLGYLVEGVIQEPALSITERLLAPGDRFLDVGANVGLFTLAAARRVGPTGAVLALEPAPATVRALQVTVALNQVAETVDIRAQAAGAKQEKRQLHLGRTCGHNSLVTLPRATPFVEVDVVPLDSIVQAGSRWSLAKIDVEGCELEVLAGMRRIIAENPSMPIIIEFSPSHIAAVGNSIHGWMQTVGEHGYAIYEIHAEPPIIRPLRASGLERIHSMDLLLVNRREGAVWDLLAEHGL